MTDISDWPDLVHVVQLRSRSHPDNNYQPPVFGRYVVVPLNEYQMGNLLDALLQVKENGDWYGELCSIVAVAMKKAAIDELTSNRGTKFTLVDVRSYCEGCPWNGMNGELIAQDKLRCPKCGSEHVKYLVADAPRSVQ